MTRQKIVVLGANSFSGQDFVDLLLDHAEYDVLGISRSAERPGLFLKYQQRKDLSRYRYFQIDLNRQMPDLLSLLDTERPPWIINFAAQSEVAPSWEHPEHWFQTNCVSLAYLVNHLRKQKYVQRYLQISSPEAYGDCRGRVTEDAPFNPSTPYAASKAAADMLLRTYQKQYGFPLMIVRGTNVYGARQQLFKIIPRSVIYLKRGKMIDLHGGGEAVKSYIHVRDVSRGELAILKQGKLGEVYHLSPDAGVAVRDVVDLICRKMGKRLVDVTRGVEERPGQDAAYVIDSSRARQEFGWAPAITLEQGVAEVVAWVDENWNAIQELPVDYQHKP